MQMSLKYEGKRMMGGKFLLKIYKLKIILKLYLYYINNIFISYFANYNFLTNVNKFIIFLLKICNFNNLKKY